MSGLTKIKIEDEKLPELEMGITHIEDLMEISIDHQNLEQVSEQLSNALNLLHTTGRLIEVATRMYDYAKGVAVYQTAMNEQTKKLPTTLQVKIVEGLICNQSGMYAKTDRVIKSLTSYIEGMRSILSSLKEERKSESYNRAQAE